MDLETNEMSTVLVLLLPSGEQINIAVDEEVVTKVVAANVQRHGVGPHSVTQPVPTPWQPPKQHLPSPGVPVELALPDETMPYTSSVDERGEETRVFGGQDDTAPNPDYATPPNVP